MYLLVLPVSGGGFVSQLAIIQHLCEINFTPDLTLASSGGNVAAYIGAAANWTWPGIERIAREMSQDLFVTPWTTVASLAKIIGYFQGNIYNKGTGVCDFLKRHFNDKSIVDYEIWTGTYNKNRRKARLFCNRHKKDSILNISCIDHDLTQSIEPKFANGNMDLIASTAIASASIPALVPAERIDNEEFVDGGVAGASPLVIMQEPIIRYVRHNKTSLHIIYVNSMDLCTSNSNQCKNVVDTWKQATHDVVKSQIVNDRISAYNLLRCHSGDMNKDEFDCTYENMKRIKLIQEKIDYSMLEIFPTESHDVNIVSFKGDDVVAAIRKVYGKCRCRLWWLTPYQNRCIGDICNIIKQCKNIEESSVIALDDLSIKDNRYS